MKRQSKIGGRLHRIKDSDHRDLDVDFQPQLPPLPQDHTKNLRMEVNWLNQKIMSPQ